MAMPNTASCVPRPRLHFISSLSNLSSTHPTTYVFASQISALPLVASLLRIQADRFWRRCLSPKSESGTIFTRSFIFLGTRLRRIYCLGISLKHNALRGVSAKHLCLSQVALIRGLSVIWSLATFLNFHASSAHRKRGPLQQPSR